MPPLFRSLCLVLALAASPLAGAESIIVASTTSTEQSGLFGHLLPAFTAATGIEVKVVAQGTGQALDTGRRGDADVVFVHDRAREEQFVADGHGINRRDVMYNDFVLIGPKDDPAGAKSATGITDALKRIATAGAGFASRGDKSGTHGAELRFWKAAGIEPTSLATYRELGAGMGPTLNTAAAMNAYTLSDRGTWLSFRNRQDLTIIFAGDPQLFNPYGVILVNPAKHPHVKAKAGQAFIDWIVSPAGQAAIAAYRIANNPLFFPSAEQHASH